MQKSRFKDARLVIATTVPMSVIMGFVSRSGHFVAARAAGLRLLTAPTVMCGTPTPVRLERAMLDDSAPLLDISNLFFEPVEESAAFGLMLRLPDWREAEAADLVGRGGPVPIVVVRHTDATGIVRYRVDTDGDGDLREESDLTFRDIREVSIADVDLAIQLLGRTVGVAAAGRLPSGTVRYQVVTSRNGYVYGRIAECRRGIIRLGGREVSILLRPRSRDDPFYGIANPPRVYLDLDRDGRIDQVLR